MLWGIVNNAGILGGTFPIDLSSVKDYERMMSVNCFGHISVTLAFLQEIKRSRGRIVNMTSVAGFLPLTNTSRYVTSKHAMEGFSETLRRVSVLLVYFPVSNGYVNLFTNVSCIITV